MDRPLGSIPPQVRAIVFDAVGTLIHPRPSVAEAYAMAGRRHGATLSADEVRRRFPAALERHFGPRISGSDVASVRTEPTATSEALERMRWRRVVADVFCEFSGEQDALFETLWDHFAEARHWVVFDDVVTTWHELARRGYQVAIASNFDQRLEQICRDLFPLSDCRHVFPSSRVGWSKPSPAFFRAIEETLQLEPAQLLLVGDDPRNDVAGALAAGWHARWLVREAESRPESALAGLWELSSASGPR